MCVKMPSADGSADDPEEHEAMVQELQFYSVMRTSNPGLIA